MPYADPAKQKEYLRQYRQKLLADPEAYEQEIQRYRERYAANTEALRKKARIRQRKLRARLRKERPDWDEWKRARQAA